MKIIRSASVGWSGGIKDGVGSVSTKGGALAGVPYGFQSRFESGAGTNPEELLGAAHAACFTMALSLILTEAGLKPTSLKTTADVALEKVEEGFSITSIKLTLRGQVPGLDAGKFIELANMAKKGCPVSKVLKTDITLDAELA